MSLKQSLDKTKPPAPSQRWSSSDSLGVKIETMLLRIPQRFIEWIVDWFVRFWDQAVIDWHKGNKETGDFVTMSIAQFALGNKETADLIQNMLNSVNKEVGSSNFIVRAFIWWSTISGLIFGGLDPIRRLAIYNADRNVRSFLPSPQELSALHLVGLVSEDAYKSNMAKLGVADPLIPVYKEFVRNLPSMGELFNGLWRGLYSEGEFIAYLKRMGYNEKDSQAIKELTKNLPPLTDLIHMLVRDAFNDQAAGQYGYDEDFPREINEFFAKQGYDPDWAKRYWRSHWYLPSPTQGYEMLHRGLITIDDLDTLLRISDYPPFWRSKLRDISYNVYTRVDARRLLQAGIITEEETFTAYKEMGYNEDKARKLTDFAIAGISQEERDLTKTDVLNLYEEGLIDKGETISNLVKMGYDSNEAESILKLSDVNIAKATRSDLINYTKEKFLAKRIDENGARGELAQIGLKQQSVDRYLLNWLRATEIESALPSMADVKRWFMADYITETQFRDYLGKHRHTAENIEIYVKEINDTKAQAENEQA